MRYEGENCPYCGVTFADGDDVVVCPDCATPHHRVCWFAHGECANAERHGTDFVWKKSAQPESQQAFQPELEKPQHENRSTANLDIVCPDCGTVCPNGTLRCPDCGAVLIPFANPMGEPPMAQFRPDFNPSEDIGGVKSGDVALFCRTAGASYIRKFRRLSSGGKLSFNWAAFLFSPFWFFYRKIYEAGAIFITVFVALNLILIPAEQYMNDSSAQLMADMQAVIEPLIDENGMYDSEEMVKAVEEFTQSNQSRIIDELLKPMIPMYVIGLLLILNNFIAALTADRLYYKKARKEIERVRKLSKDCLLYTSPSPRD